MDGGGGKVKVLRPMKAMRKKCLDCQSGAYKKVRNCDDLCCALWPYRMGRRPQAGVVGQVEAAAEMVAG